MKDEIKEIKVNKSNKSITFINNGIAFLQFEVADEILDLITNLQEENEFLKDLKYFTTDEIYKELGKRLQECADVSEELANECNDNQERNEKAIEFVEQNLEGIGYVEVCDLLHILQGEDKDE